MLYNHKKDVLKMKDSFSNIWDSLVKIYTSYSDFVHSIIPGQLGDLVVFILNLIVVCIIVKIIASVAFGTKGDNG